MAKKRDRNEKKYKAALSGKKIPVLTLDNKWHKLFTQTGTTPEIEALSEKLNGLLKVQGKLGSEMKELRRLKKKLMDTIVTSMSEAEQSAESEKRMEESRRLIEGCNEKLEDCQEKYLTLPEEIDAVNYELMLATMEICYDRLQQNTKQINEIGQWITQTRIELKKKLIKKQESELVNHALYSYMHDIFGAEVIEIFDMEYKPAGKKTGEKKEE